MDCWCGYALGRPRKSGCSYYIVKVDGRLSRARQAGETRSDHRYSLCAARRRTPVWHSVLANRKQTGRGSHPIKYAYSRLRRRQICASGGLDGQPLPLARAAADIATTARISAHAEWIRVPSVALGIVVPIRWAVGGDARTCVRDRAAGITRVVARMYRWGQQSRCGNTKNECHQKNRKSHAHYKSPPCAKVTGGHNGQDHTVGQTHRCLAMQIPFANHLLWQSAPQTDYLLARPEAQGRKHYTGTHRLARTNAVQRNASQVGNQ